MIKWVKQLDHILRGDATQLSALREGRIEISIGGLTVVIAMLGMIYGFCMGSYALLRSGGSLYMQLIASGIKIPLLFFLTLLVTFPSLYVFNALVGSRLKLISALRLLVCCYGVIIAVWASLGPIVVFFSLSTDSYSFMVLLNVITGSVAGVLGLSFLLRTMNRLVISQNLIDQRELLETQIEPTQSENESKITEMKKLPEDIKTTLQPLEDPTSKRAKQVFKIWTFVFALIGAQMSWVLRPFIGNPNLPFEWFRERQGNFFQAVFNTIINLFSM